MTRWPLFLFALTACSPAGLPGPESGSSGAGGAKLAAGQVLHDLLGFEPPFGWVPLTAEYIRGHELRRMSLHHDSDVDKGRYRDIEIETFEYDRDGRLLSKETVSRGEPTARVRYIHEGGRLVREIHENARTPDSSTTVSHTYDGRGRLAKSVYTSGSRRWSEYRKYDSAGQLQRIVQAVEDGDASLESFHERGRLVRQELVTVTGDKHQATFEYDGAGRLVRRTGDNGHGRHDDYRFLYDSAGRLASQSFAENDKLVYRRHYTYDQDGLLIREQLQSAVSAMGNGEVIRYEYERHSDPPSLTVEPANRQHTPDEITAVVIATFPGAYTELATVTFETMGEGRHHPQSVTFLVPEALVSRQSDEDLARHACQAKKKLGWECACETVKRGEPADYAWHSWPDKRVVPLTVDFALGC